MLKGAKVDMSKLDILKFWTPLSEWYVVRCGSKNWHQKDVFKRKWTTCSKYPKHTRLSSQHDWGGIYITS